MRGFNAVFNHALAGHGILNAALATTSAPVIPGVVPTAPGPNDVFKEGAQCTFSWTPDPSGQWKQLTVQLMSGDNFNMVPVTTVATIDGTDTTKTTYSYACPDVQPNSAIYFYQFSTPAAPKNLTWTTRFTIAAADGSTTPPANDTQPGGQKIPWGVGALVDQSKVVPPPDYLGGGAGATGSGTAAPSATSSTSVSTTSASSSSSDSSASSASTAPATTSSAGPGSGASSTDTSGVETTVTVSLSTAGSSPSTTSGSNQSSSGGTNNGALGGKANVAFGTIAMGLTAAVFALLS
ncbi:hypothetical protein BD309DRAFT_718509 [Dichomitus squalens]|uniref:Uncharacterized protein n=1 Tax=Dichomitus squalens TaxID=114155 RepID=A0A4Q9NVF8_9APHY|nr:hypothetical protein BD309DRAFT_718509 [Dichomitus squalens]TBU54041.1 hypothetical protein BD310DRAFT_886743 [Dichomitus squalens]